MSIFIIVGVLSLVYMKKNETTIVKVNAVVTPTTQPIKNTITEVIYPIDQFRQRITKKPFGIYITPKTSPVQPERFTGFHTGVDIEYEDVQSDVPVFSVCDGEIVLARWVSGYGGAAVLKCQLKNVNYYLVYGHLRVTSITKKVKVKRAEQIAVLGTGHTKETDFERKHLHFAIHKNSLDLRGYVQNKSQLSGWIDPLNFTFN